MVPGNNGGWGGGRILKSAQITRGVIQPQHLAADAALGWPHGVQTIMTGGEDEAWAGAGGVTVAADEANFKIGTQGLKLTTAGEVTANGFAQLEAMIPNDPLPLAPFQALGMWVYVDDPTKVTAIKPILYTAANKSTNMSFGLSAAQIAALQAGWNYVRVSSGEATTSLIADGVFALWIDFRTNAATTITIGHIVLECPDKARLVIVSDGCYQTFHDAVLPSLRSLRAPVTWGVNPTKMGETGVAKPTITTAALLAQLNAGYGDEISFHSYDRADMSGYTAAQVRADTFKCLKWIGAYIMPGLTGRRSAGPVWRSAWTSNNCPQHAGAQNVLTMYASPTNLAGMIPWPPIDCYNVPRLGITPSSTADLDIVFAKLQQTHGMYVLYFHGLSAEDYDTTVAVLAYLVAKIRAAQTAGWLECVTMGELMGRIGARYQRGLAGGPSVMNTMDAAGAALQRLVI